MSAWWIGKRTINGAHAAFSWYFRNFQNNWESTYFNFNEDILCDMIEKAKGTGIDTFVLDDGWFGVRNSDTTGLGDWFVNQAKLPGGLKNVIKKCHECGMKFGIWIEPEMISEDSQLYQEHPDWCIRMPELPPCKSRHQLVLDFSNPKVVGYIKECIE
ncbi:MAG: alpha-galactosidase [Tyzzerella sp.]|nr:alpha-galactosidase [Tyzzerella sp.]